MRKTRRWWRSVVLTGASGGIGRALAAEFAAEGITMLLLGRDETRLEAAAASARARGADADVAVADVRDGAAMGRILTARDRHAPVDLVIANAGVSAGRPPGGEPGLPAIEPAGTLVRLTEINLVGAANTVAPLLGPMCARRRGRIVLVGSLAGLRPLPDMPAYSASKAGLRAWGTALRGALRGSGVGVTIVTPGFVASPMSARHLGPRPFELPAADAARRIRRGVARERALITFPWQLAMLAWLGARLPPGFSDRAVTPFGACILPDGDPGEEAAALGEARPRRHG